MEERFYTKTFTFHAVLCNVTKSLEKWKSPWDTILHVTCSRASRVADTLLKHWTTVPRLLKSIKTHIKCYLTASSSSSSLTNCRGTCKESTLSAICSRIRRWLPSVVGKRYVRDMTPPKTEPHQSKLLKPYIITGSECLFHMHRHSPAFSSWSLHRAEDLDLMPMDSVRLSSTGRTIWHTQTIMLNRHTSNPAQ